MDTAAASAQRRWLPWARRQAAAYLAAAGGGDDGWAASAVRVVVCFLAMALTTAVWAVLMLLLLPWPSQRIRQSNVYGHVTGRMLLWILGNPIKVEGAEHLNTRGIFICNHASPLDIFLVMWLAPTGTVGIAKKEIIWYPLFGQLYVLANHLRIDRSNPAAAIHSMKQVARAVVKNNLSLILFPEGTRSKNGRLLPFKKGFVHAALQTGLPVVPVVVTGTHLAWRNAPGATHRQGPAADWDRRLGGGAGRRARRGGAVDVRLQPPRLAEAAGRSGRPEERLICHRPDEDSCQQCSMVRIPASRVEW